MTILKTIALLVITVAVLLGDPAGASTRLEGQLPDKIPVVSIDQSRGTILDALEAISKQAGWSLVVIAPESLTVRTLTIHLAGRPADEALEIVLNAGVLKATYTNGVLTVRAATAGAGSDSERESRRARRLKNERVAIGHSLRVEANEVVTKAVAIGGSLTVLGHVRGDAVAIGGSVTLLPGSQVEGNAVAIGGSVKIEEGAQLEGDNVTLAGGSVGGIMSSLIRLVVGEGDRHFSGARAFFGFASRLMRSLLLFFIALLIVLAIPEHVTRARTFLASRPGLSSLTGLALLLGFPPLCVLLAVTLIGIPLIPLTAMLLVVLFLFGITAFAMWLGEKIPLLEENKTPVRAVALGSGVLVVVGLIPWVGTLAIALAAIFSGGAALLSRFGRRVEAAA